MKKIYVLIIGMIICITNFTSCKKNDLAAQNDFKLLQDGPFSSALGKRIFIGKENYPRTPVVWGRNSDELFVNGSTEVLIIDFLQETIKSINNEGALAFKKSAGNGGVLIIGNFQRDYGCFEYGFKTNSIEKLVDFSADKIQTVNVGKEDIFLSVEKLWNSGNQCTFCVPLPDTAIFFHIDRQSGNRRELPLKKFMIFSKDGNKSVLANQFNDSIYIFNNITHQIESSSQLNVTYVREKAYFFDEIFVKAEYNNVFKQLLITNAVTNDILDIANISGLTINDQLEFSPDGTKLFYSGGYINGITDIIAMYDLKTRQEKIIAEVHRGSNGSPIINNYTISDDCKKMIVAVGNDLYLKTLED